MPALFLASVVDEPLMGRRLRLLAVGGIVLAVLFAIMAVGGLFVPAIYARETPAWAQQAYAQDWFDLLVAAPLLVVAALWAARGSRRGLLAYAGVLLFSVYTAAIYAFSVHLNALFLVYCAALGVGLYTLIGCIARVWQARAGLQVSFHIPQRFAGTYLIVIGVGFGFLWLAQLIPAALHGTVPPELRETGLFTNPVHVIDLAFILPLHVIAGVALRRMKTALALVAPIVLVFGAVMAASIGLLGAYAGQVPLAIGLGIVSLTATVLSALVIRSLR